MKTLQFYACVTELPEQGERFCSGSGQLATSTAAVLNFPAFFYKTKKQARRNRAMFHRMRRHLPAVPIEIKVIDFRLSVSHSITKERR